MNKTTAAIIVKALTDLDLTASLKEYSGRGMYGEITQAVYTNANPFAVMGQVATWMGRQDNLREVYDTIYNEELTDEERHDVEDYNESEHAISFDTLRSDNMGHGWVLY